MNPIVNFLLTQGISYLLYFVIFIAAYRLVIVLNEKEINGRRIKKKVKSRLHKQVIETKAKVEEINEDKRLGRLELLLRATAKNEKRTSSVFAFLLLSGSLGIATFILLLFRLGDLYISTGLGFFVSMIPYLFLIVKFRKQKSSVSNNITMIIEELIHHYSANGHDMYQAVKQVAINTKNMHYRQLFLQIASAMHLRQEEAVREAVEVLMFSIGGTWAKRLGNIILAGFLRSDSVLTAMVHLSKNAQANEGMLKQEKSASLGVRLAAYATVPFMLVTLMINTWMTRSFDYWDIQFGNPFMVFLLVITVAMICVSLIIAQFVANPKNDI